MVGLEHLHDATLVALEVRWADGTLRCTFGVSMGERKTVSAVAHGLALLKCTREFPWGESVSVNSVNMERSGMRSRLLIEMQSGDTIEAVAEELVVE